MFRRLIEGSNPNNVDPSARVPGQMRQDGGRRQGGLGFM